MVNSKATEHQAIYQGIILIVPVESPNIWCNERHVTLVLVCNEADRPVLQGIKIKKRKRHVCADTMGNLLCIKVGSAQESDIRIGPDVIYQTFRRYGSLLDVCADQEYRSTTAQFVQKELKMRTDIIEKPKDSIGFQIIQ